MTEKEILEGVIPDSQIRALISGEFIRNANVNCIQPASLDLQPDLNAIFELSHITFPRRSENIDDLLNELRRTGIAKEVKNPTLFPGKWYLVKLKEELKTLPYFARVNPKSSIGRIFNHTRLICSKQGGIDIVTPGYSGSIWLLVAPKFFPITLSETEQLNQMRFFSGDARLKESELRRYMKKHPEIVTFPRDMFSEQVLIEGNAVAEVPVSVDLHGKCYKTKKTNRPLNLSHRNVSFEEYFEVIEPESMERGLLLEQGYGYLIGTLEQIRVPHDLATEVTISDRFGEIKAHFAGFIDPLFGNPKGNSITLEIVSYEPGLMIRHGQEVTSLRFEWMASPPEKGYAGNYTNQERGAKLPKYLFDKSA